MSKEVDTRVVEMRFEDEQFNEGIQRSGRNLDKFKEKLDFKNASSGIEELQRSGEKFDLGGMESAAERVTASFSAMQIAVASVINNVVSDVYGLGKRIANELTIAPLAAGFSEYELKMKSVQTILANTSQKGSTLKDVNKVLDEMNEYADKTIYNFAQMTDNMGKFTAAGLGLEESANSIKGMMNLAALAGATNEAAQRASYQTSQALSAGVFRLMDWRSLTNAGMNVERFRNAIIETAEKRGVDYDKLLAKYGSFEQTLQNGWLSSGIFEESLAKLTGEYSKEQWIAIGYTEEEAAAIEQLGQDASDAATKVRTFTQLVDTVKESLGSGWTNSWELVFGDFEEATVLWTEVNDVISGFINKQTEARNNTIETWKLLGGRTALIDSVRNVFEALLSIATPIKEAFSEVFKPLDGSTLNKITQKIKEFTANLKLTDEESENLKKVFKGLFTVVQTVGSAFGSVIKTLSPMTGLIRPIVDKILELAAGLSEIITGTATWVNQSQSVQNIVAGIASAFQNGSIKAANFIKKLDFTKIKQTIQAIGTAIGGVITTLFGKENEIGESLQSFANMADSFSTGAVSLQTLNNTMAEANAETGKLKANFSSITSWYNTNLAPKIDEIKKQFEGTSLYDVIGLVELGFIWKWLKKVAGALGNLKDVFDGFGELVKAAKNAINGLTKTMKVFQGTLRAETIKRIAESVLILAGAVAVLAVVVKSVGIENVGVAAGVVAGLLTAMTIMFNAFSKMEIDNGKMLGVAAAMTGVGIALGIISLAIGHIAKAGIDNSLIATLEIVALIKAMTIAMSDIGKIKNEKAITSAAKSMTTMAVGIKVMAMAIEPLGKMAIGELVQGGVAVVALSGVMTASIAALEQVSKGHDSNMKIISSANMAGIAASMLAFAGGMVALTIPVKTLAAIDASAMWRGVGAVSALAGVMTACIAALKLASGSWATKNTAFDAGGMLGLAVTMTAFAGAMVALVIPITAIAGLDAIDADRLDKSLATVKSLMAAMTACISIMALVNKSFSANGGYLNGIKALDGKITAQANIMYSVAAAMVSFGAALQLITLAVAKMTALSYSDHYIQGLAGVGAEIAAMVGSIVAISIFAPNIDKVTVSLAGFGVAIAAMTAAVVMLSKISFGEVAQGLINFVSVLAGAVGISAMLSKFSVGLDKIAKSVALIGAGTLAFTAAITIAVAGLALFGPAISAAIDSLEGLYPKLKEAIPLLADLAAYAITVILEKIAEYTPRILDAIDQIIDAIAEHLGISAGTLKLITAGAGLAGLIFKGFIDYTKASAVTIVTDASSKAIADAIAKTAASSALGTAIKSLGSSIATALAGAFSAAWPALFLGAVTVGSAYVITKYNNEHPIDMDDPEIQEAMFGDVYTDANGKGYSERVKEEGRATGAGYASGTAEGIKSGIPEVEKSSLEMAQRADAAARSKAGFDEHSPSVSGHETGEFYGQGVANGIEQSAPYVENAALNMAQTVATTTETTLQEATDKAKEKIGDAIESGKEIISSAGDGFKNTVGDALDDAAAILEEKGIEFRKAGEANAAEYNSGFLGTLITADGTEKAVYNKAVTKNGIDLRAPNATSGLSIAREIDSDKQSYFDYLTKTWTDAAGHVDMNKVQQAFVAKFAGAGTESEVEDITQEAQDLMNLWYSKNGTTGSTGTTTSTTKAKTAAELRKEKYNAIVAEFSDAISAADLDYKTADLEYQLWEAMNEPLDETDQYNAEWINKKYTKKNELLAKQIAAQTTAVTEAELEYAKVSTEMGEASEEAQTSYNKLLTEQKELQELQNDLNQQAKNQTDELKEAAEKAADKIEEAYNELADGIERASAKSEKVRTLISNILGNPDTDASENAADAIESAKSELESAVSNAKSVYSSLQSEKNLVDTYNRMVSEYGADSDEAKAYRKDLILQELEDGTGDTEALIAEYKSLLDTSGFSSAQMEKLDEALRSIADATNEVAAAEAAVNEANTEEQIANMLELWQTMDSGKTTLAELTALQNRYNSISNKQSKEAKEAYNDLLDAQNELVVWTSEVAEKLDLSPSGTRIANSLAYGFSKAWPSVQNELSKAMEGLAPYLDTLGVPEDIQEVLTEGCKTLDFSDLVSIIVEKIVKKVLESEAVANGVKAIMDFVSSLFKENSGGLTDVLSSIISGAFGSGSGGSSGFSLEGLGQLISSIGGSGTATGGTAGLSLDGVWEAISGWLGLGGSTAAAGGTAAASGAVGAAATETATALTTTATAATATTGAATAATGALGTMATALTGPVGIVAAAAAAVAGLKIAGAEGQTFGEKLMNAITGLDVLKETFSNLTNLVTNSNGKGFWGNLLDTGKNLVKNYTPFGLIYKAVKGIAGGSSSSSNSSSSSSSGSSGSSSSGSGTSTTATVTTSENPFNVLQAGTTKKYAYTIKSEFADVMPEEMQKTLTKAAATFDSLTLGGIYDRGDENMVTKIFGTLVERTEATDDEEAKRLAELLKQAQDIANSTGGILKEVLSGKYSGNDTDGITTLQELMLDRNPFGVSIDGAQKALTSLETQSGAETKNAYTTSYTFNQNNYSPKALSRTEIYRQTRNQFAMLKK